MIVAKLTIGGGAPHIPKRPVVTAITRPVTTVPWRRFAFHPQGTRSNVIVAPGGNMHPPTVHHGGIHRNAVAATMHPNVTLGGTTSHNISFNVKGRR